MIFLHFILGLIAGGLYGSHTLFFIGASMLPDIDHLYLIFKHKIFPMKRTIRVLKKEEKHGIHFKTPFMHSLLGLAFFTILFYAITQSNEFTLLFALMYGSHLLLDWPDIDKKEYLFPYRKEFKGFLPIWSKTEKVITFIAIITAIIVHMA
ncbi:metal-dependent hydrolase [Candidatus Pacearchaeota archaeon]|nr:metal-dependent hydrolase [Candidatus Pacearchaeota archaeon]